MFFLLLFLGLTAIHATVTVEPIEGNIDCKTLDSDIRKFIFKDPSANNMSGSELVHSMEICKNESILPTTLTLAISRGHVNIFRKMLAIGVPIIEPALTIRHLSQFGYYVFVYNILSQNPVLTEEFELAMNDAIDTLGCSQNRINSITGWEKFANALFHKYYGKSRVGQGWHRILMSASQCSIARPDHDDIVELAISNAKQLLSLSEMEEVLESALKFKNRKMVTLIEEHWPELLWERLSSTIIRSTMDIELLKKIQMHLNPYLSKMKVLMPAYNNMLYPQEVITGSNEISENYWKGVGYILGSHLEQFEIFWTQLKNQPNAQGHYYVELIKAACLARNEQVVSFLLRNPSIERPLNMKLKIDIAYGLLPAPETIAWLQPDLLPNLYCSLADSDVTYETRLVLLKLYASILRDDQNFDIIMVPQCYSNLKDTKISVDLVSEINRKYQFVRIHPDVLNTNSFYLKYLVDGKFYSKIRQDFQNPLNLFKYLVDNEEFDFVVESEKARLLNVLGLIALAFDRKKVEFAFRLMKKFNISSEAVLDYAKKKNLNAAKKNFELNLWGTLQ